MPRRRLRSVPRRLPRPGHAPPAAVDDAPGGPLPARVPGGAQQGLVPRAVQEPGAGGRGDPAADPALRLRRRHPVLGPADPAGGDGPAGGLHRRGPDPAPARCAATPIWPASTPFRPGAEDALRARDHRAACAAGLRPRRRSSASPARRSRWPPTPSRARPRKRFIETKKLFYREPADRAPAAGAASPRPPRDYLLAQVAAGAQAIQIFDSWLGVVSVEEWDEFVREPTARAGAGGARHRRAGDLLPQRGHHHPGPGGAGRAPTSTASTGACPSTRRARGCSTAAPSTRRCRATSIRPCCWARPTASSALARDIVERGQRRGHVFNLGHGIYPETPITGVETLVRAVKGA